MPYSSFLNLATGIPNCSRYFATVRLAILYPFCVSMSFNFSSDSGFFLLSAAIIKMFIAVQFKNWCSFNKPNNASFCFVSGNVVSAEDSQVSVLSSRGPPIAVYVTAGCLAVFLCVVAAVGARSHNNNVKRRQRASRSLT